MLSTKIFQKQPPRGIPRKRCSENMQQIYKRTPMPKCDFNKVAKQLYWNHTLAWVFSCKFGAIFRTPFTKNTAGRLLLSFPKIISVHRKISKKLSFVANFSENHLMKIISKQRYNGDLPGKKCHPCIQMVLGQPNTSRSL